MKIYSVENGYQKKLFTSFESANASFIETARDILRSYKDEYNDMGYLDLNMWIAVYDDNKGPPKDYYVPNMSNIREDGDIGPQLRWLHYSGPRQRIKKI